MIFETHAHYDDERFEEDRDALITSMPGRGVGTIINVGASIESTKTTLALSEKYPFVYAAVGVHPSDISGLNEETFAWLKEQTKKEKVAAVGEIGLDYYWDKEPEVQKQQRYWFAEQMKMAREASLPVIIHSRDAAADTMEVMKSVHAEEIPGVIHCYSYSKEMAQEFIKMGYYIGVGGVVTFKNAKKLKETVQEIPLDRILLETDCPYMAPEPHRGERNDSSYIPFVIKKIAELRGITPEEVEQAPPRNAVQPAPPQPRRAPYNIPSFHAPGPLRTSADRPGTGSSPVPNSASYFSLFSLEKSRVSGK